MKLQPLVETRSNAAPFDNSSIPEDEERHVSTRRLVNRPTETEADLIAAAAWPGEVTINYMLSLKRDNESCTDDCDFCSTGQVS